MPELDARTKKLLSQRLKELIAEGKVNTEEADKIKALLFPIMGGKRKTKRGGKKAKKTRKSRSWW